MLKTATVEADANMKHVIKGEAQTTKNVLSEHDEEPAAVEGETKSDIVVEKIEKIIKQQYSKHLTIEDIAKQISYSKKQAQRIFLKKTGKTIYKYLTEYRIERAKELLVAEKSKIYVSAEQVGYKNTLHFKKLFEKHTGMTPAEYKKEKKKDTQKKL